MENKGNKKLIWYILFAIITIIMCYLFCVVYFLFISPYNVSIKTKIWPFLTNAQIGAMYNDAIVDIKFEIFDEEYFGNVKVSVSGVNLRQDGYVIARHSDFEGLAVDDEIQIFPNSGECYSGKILYTDKNSNISILKCESLNGDKVNLPYVTIGSVSDEYIIDTEIIAIETEARKVSSGTIVDEKLICDHTSVSEGVFRVDYVMENCFSVDMKKDFSEGIAFDKFGNVMGFFVEEFEAKQIFMPVENVKLYFDDVVKSYNSNEVYTNELIKSFVGFDTYEINCFIEQSSKNENKNQFYFNGNFENYTDNLNYFARGNETGFFIFEDMKYNGNVVLKAESVVSKIKLDDEIVKIDCRDDLVKLVYSAVPGQKTTVYYFEIDALGSQIKSVSFEI